MLLLHNVFPAGSYVMLIVYVDDKLFAGNNEATFQEFKEKLSKGFDVEFLGQAHWYIADMGTKILGRILLDSFKELYFPKSLSRSENSGGVLRYTCSSGIC
jgi:hypothetical protein